MSASVTTPRLAALRHRDFRLFWGGELISSIGSQMQIVAINWHVYQLLRGTVYTLAFFGQRVSVDAGALGLGLLGLARIFPLSVLVCSAGCWRTALIAASSFWPATLLRRRLLPRWPP